MKRALLTLSLLTVIHTTVGAANLTGRWSLDLLPDFGGMNDTIACSFLQEGQKLTLHCGGPSTISGDVQGRKVTLHVPTGPNNESIAILVGELGQREAIISGTWRLAANDHGPREGKFVAKRTIAK